MKTIFLMLAVAVLFTSGIPSGEEFPEATISNGIIKATMYLPDPGKGYYRATRFDWSGVIPALTFKGHQYFGTWNPASYNPKLNDAIMGPVEEFGPLGYAPAHPGETFVKIGVGGLKKIEEPGYRYGYTYDIVNPGKWTVVKSNSSIRFTHELSDASGYRYVYDKTISLVSGKPLMVIEHTLKNTGLKPIATTVYNHNFFVIDKEPTGPNMKMSFPFSVSAPDRGGGSLKGFGTIASIQNKSIIYNRALEKGEQVYSSGLQGFNKTPDDYQFISENLKSGAGVKVTSDQVLDKLVYWACPTTACAEPYIQLDVDTGKEISWKYNYEFFISGQSK